MNKDALLATLIGFIVGLLITGLILVGPSVIARLPKISLPTITLPTKGTTPATMLEAKEFSLTIDSPLADEIASGDELLVSGTTQIGATVIIQTDTDDAVVVSGTDGKYAGKITLSEGKNDLSVTSYLLEKHMSQKRTVYFTPEEL